MRSGYDDGASPRQWPSRSPSDYGGSFTHVLSSRVANTRVNQGREQAPPQNTKTVGLCTDPVTLDYWMGKYVMYPAATSQSFMNPDNDSDLRKQLVACNSKGVGTLKRIADFGAHRWLTSSQLQVRT